MGATTVQPEIDVMIETEDGWSRGAKRYSVIDQGCLDASDLSMREVKEYFARLVNDGAMLPEEPVRFHAWDDGGYYDTTAGKFGEIIAAGKL
jgi:hypothetical protein